jgi:hypothetical protein
VAGVRNACGPWLTPLWPLPCARLDRQESLRPLAGEVPVEGIDAEGQHAVVPHEHGQFCQPLHAELLLRGLEGPTADPVGPEELLAVSYHRVVYLSPADKYHRLTRRLSQGQKGLDERALMASQRPSAPW